MAVRVVGKVNPLMENAAPVTFAPVIVTEEPPVLVSVSCKLALLPTWTLGKARLVGFALNMPGVTPVPESGMVSVEFEALEVMITLPLAAPAATGANFTVNEVLWLAFKVRGSVSPLKLNPLPLTEAAEMVTLVLPVLVRVTD